MGSAASAIDGDDARTNAAVADPTSWFSACFRVGGGLFKLRDEVEQTSRRNTNAWDFVDILFGGAKEKVWGQPQEGGG